MYTIKTWTTRYQPRYPHHQSWITVTNHGSDTNTSKNRVQFTYMSVHACRQLPSEARFHNYFTIFRNTKNSNFMLICGTVAYHRFGWPSMWYNSAPICNVVNYGYETSTSQLVTLSATDDCNFLSSYAVSFGSCFSTCRRIEGPSTYTVIRISVFSISVVSIPYNLNPLHYITFILKYSALWHRAIRYASASTGKHYEARS
jgi:hypothetical protein